MHISITFCLDFFITSRSIHVVLIGFQYIFVSFCILVYFVAFRILIYFVSLRFVSHFSIFRFVAFRFAFQYISLRNISFRFVSFRFVRCVSISFCSLVQPDIYTSLQDNPALILPKSKLAAAPMKLGVDFWSPVAMRIFF